MYLLNNVKFNPNIQRTIGETQYPSGWFIDPIEREKIGVTEVPDPVMPDDNLFTSIENPDGSYTATPRTHADLAERLAIATKDAEDNLRTERNRLLAETDYFALSDVTMSAEMTEYRKLLRDLPANTDDVFNPVYPETPE
jgi:hypothetical protein